MTGKDADVLVVVVWYRPDQYAAVRTFAADSARMEKTFQEWKLLADKSVEELVRQGNTVRKVDFDHAAFIRWAAAHKVKSTQQSRIAFCTEIATRN